jgi:hypothetical protein
MWQLDHVGWIEGLRVLDWFRHQNQEKIYCGNRDASEIDAEGAMARVAQSGGS